MKDYIPYLLEIEDIGDETKKQHYFDLIGSYKL
jgi:hypothetical protein